ncbi:hypothetical protein BCAR13_230001 [Paraburkholderia caribensis]|nr:hypothetical protein BCAR13_230001 [Paraburkholderia caribensis]
MWGGSRLPVSAMCSSPMAIRKGSSLSRRGRSIVSGMGRRLGLRMKGIGICGSDVFFVFDARVVGVFLVSAMLFGLPLRWSLRMRA